MSDTKKLAYMIAALETSQAEISVATADMKDTARDCKIYASKLRDTTNMDIIEIERRLTIGTEAFQETVKKETDAISDVSIKTLLKIISVSVSAGLVVAAVVSIYSWSVFSSLASAKAELRLLEPRVETLQQAAAKLESIEAIKPITVNGARRAIQLPGQGWESMKTESDTILYKR